MLRHPEASSQRGVPRGKPLRVGGGNCGLLFGCSWTPPHGHDLGMALHGGGRWRQRRTVGEGHGCSRKLQTTTTQPPPMTRNGVRLQIRKNSNVANKRRTGVPPPPTGAARSQLSLSEEVGGDAALPLCFLSSSFS